MRFLLPLACLLLTVCAARAQVLNVPARPANALSGSQFASVISAMPLTEREHWIHSQIMRGNVPDFLRALVPVSATGTIDGIGHTATFYALPDYIAVGHDGDYFLTPLTPLLGQRLADALGCTLPTRKMVNQIWTNAPVKMPPQPIQYSADMITVPVFRDHNFMVRTQRNLTTNSFPLGTLVSGNKKDVIISSLIYSNLHGGVPKPVVIYGWHYPSGEPIQPAYNGHEETYADYSHGIRLVQNAMLLDGQPTTVSGVLTNPGLAVLLSDEGAIAVPRYTVGQTAPVLLTHPRSQTVRPGADVKFDALGSGFPSPACQWRLLV